MYGNFEKGELESLINSTKVKLMMPYALIARLMSPSIDFSEISVVGLQSSCKRSVLENIDGHPSSLYENSNDANMSLLDIADRIKTKKTSKRFFLCKERESLSNKDIFGDESDDDYLSKIFDEEDILEADKENKPSTIKEDIHNKRKSGRRVSKNRISYLNFTFNSSHIMTKPLDMHNSCEDDEKEDVNKSLTVPPPRLPKHTPIRSDSVNRYNPFMEKFLGLNKVEFRLMASRVIVTAEVCVIDNVRCMQSGRVVAAEKLQPMDHMIEGHFQRFVNDNLISRPIGFRRNRLLQWQLPVLLLLADVKMCLQIEMLHLRWFKDRPFVLEVVIFNIEEAIKCKFTCDLNPIETYYQRDFDFNVMIPNVNVNRIKAILKKKKHIDNTLHRTIEDLLRELEWDEMYRANYGEDFVEKEEEEDKDDWSICKRKQKKEEEEEDEDDESF